MEFLLKVQKFLAFALHHTCNRYSRPAAYHLGYVVGSNLLAYHCLAVLRAAQLSLYALYVVLEVRQAAVAYLSHTLVVAFTLGTLGLELELLHLLLVLLYLVDKSFLAFPFCAERLFLVSQFGYFLVELFYLRLVVLTFDGLTLNLELFQLTCYLVELLRNRVALHTQLRCCLIHEVDGLIRQETVGDVTLRKFHGSYAGIILNTYFVMVLVAFLQTTQDAYRAQLVRLVHHDGLETTLESLILLEVFLILVEGRGTDATQLTTCKGRFQNVGSVHGTLTASSTDKGVYLIDEEDYAAVAVGHFLYDALQTLLELAFVFGSGNQRTHVERVELLVFQVLGHIAADYTFGQTFDDGGLTCSRFTYKNRVVLRTP